MINKKNEVKNALEFYKKINKGEKPLNNLKKNFFFQFSLSSKFRKKKRKRKKEKLDYVVFTMREMYIAIILKKLNI